MDEWGEDEKEDVGRLVGQECLVEVDLVNREGVKSSLVQIYLERIPGIA